MRKHRLRYAGAPHTEDGALMWRSIAGGGRAKCSCGWLSHELPSGGARRRAHKAHKLTETSWPFGEGVS